MKKKYFDICYIFSLPFPLIHYHHHFSSILPIVVHDMEAYTLLCIPGSGFVCDLLYAIDPTG